MNHNSKIYVAGHNGLAGSAILCNLKEAGFKNIIVKNKYPNFFMNVAFKYVSFCKSKSIPLSSYAFGIAIFLG